MLGLGFADSQGLGASVPERTQITLERDPQGFQVGGIPNPRRSACRGLRFILPEPFTGLWLAGNEGMARKMDNTIIGYTETTVRILHLLYSIA